MIAAGDHEHERVRHRDGDVWGLSDKTTFGHSGQVLPGNKRIWANAKGWYALNRPNASMVLMISFAIGGKAFTEKYFRDRTIVSIISPQMPPSSTISWKQNLKVRTVSGVVESTNKHFVLDQIGRRNLLRCRNKIDAVFFVADMNDRFMSIAFSYIGSPWLLSWTIHRMLVSNRFAETYRYDGWTPNIPVIMCQHRSTTNARSAYSLKQRLPSQRNWSKTEEGRYWQH